MIIQVQLLRHQYFPSNFAFISLLDTPPVPCYTIIKSNIEGVHTGFQNPDFTAILKSYREKFGPIGEGVLGHDFFEAVFHRWEKTVHND